jgi:hypothetical protein
MGCRAFRLACLAAIAIPSAGAQVAQQSSAAAGGLVTRTFTDQERWTRLRGHDLVFFAAGLAEAKARGQTAADYAQLLADMMAPTWGPKNTGDPIRFIRGMAFNWAAFPGRMTEIESATDTLVVARVPRNYAPAFGTKQKYFDMTLDEYERTFSMFLGDVASYLGIHYADRVDGDWLIVTVHGVGSGAVLRFPARTYTTTIATNDVPDRPGVAGKWEVNFAPNGRVSLRHDGTAVLDGGYTLSLDQISFARDDRGSAECHAAATYRWTATANGDLSLGVLDDACAGRATVFGQHNLTAK